MDKITNNECYGCFLCEYKCPQQAIYETFDECGFSYPSIDNAKCVDCHLCVKICIANHTPQFRYNLEKAYSISLKNKRALLNSASGGAAYAIYSTAIKSGFVVYGVGYNSDYTDACYYRIDSTDDILKLQDSKYFHANNKVVLFKCIEQDLNQNKDVLVIGLPCEIAALRREFGDKLVLGELFCHGVTTTFVHTKYIKRLTKNKNRKLKRFTVKGKKEGWNNKPLIEFELQNGRKGQVPFYQSSYGYAFSHLSRKSCYECTFKGNNRTADFSIGDFWGITNEDPCFNRDGVSVIQIHTSSGMDLLECSFPDIEYSLVNYEMTTSGNEWVDNPIPKKGREEYAKMFAKKPYIYTPLSVLIKRLIKNVISKY
jgi:coenzyme F420-reducing hydrogenase beta subunit